MKRKARAMGTTYNTVSNTSPIPPKVAHPTTSTSSGLTFPLNVDILEEIFVHLPYDQVVLTCRLVSHQWKQVADSNSFWRERCRREGYRHRDVSTTPDDWRLFYFLCKKRKNLIQNPRGEDEMKGWKIIRNGGDRWAVHSIGMPHPNESVKKNFMTLNSMCIKSQLIDLMKEGYNPSFMDDFQPPIKISDWYAHSWDCGCEYAISVWLLDEEHLLYPWWERSIVLGRMVRHSFNREQCQSVPWRGLRMRLLKMI